VRVDVALLCYRLLNSTTFWLEMADESPKRKRKREETIEARITYHTPTKTFERLFHGLSALSPSRPSLTDIFTRKPILKPDMTRQTRVLWAHSETSLEDTKRVVRRKLGLADNAKVQLAQMRGGNAIVLEDGACFSTAGSGQETDAEQTMISKLSALRSKRIPW